MSLAYIAEWCLLAGVICQAGAGEGVEHWTDIAEDDYCLCGGLVLSICSTCSYAAEPCIAKAVINLR